MYYKYWVDNSLKIYVFFAEDDIQLENHIRPYFIRMLKSISDDLEVNKLFNGKQLISMQGLACLPELNLEIKTKPIFITKKSKMNLNQCFCNLIQICGQELIDYVKKNGKGKSDPIYYFELCGCKCRQEYPFKKECPAFSLEKKMFDNFLIRRVTLENYKDEEKRRMNIFQDIKNHIVNFDWMANDFIKID